MPTILFIHGTGVREPSFSRTFRVVKAKLLAVNSDWKVERCYWGEKFGVQLTEVKTVPRERVEVDNSERAAGEASDAELNVTVWQMLYADPFFELRWIASSNANSDGDEEWEAPAPGEALVGTTVRKQLDDFTQSPELESALRDCSLVDDESPDLFAQSLETLRQADVVDAALGTNNPELPFAVVRALLALTIANAVEHGAPAPSDIQRAKLVEIVLGEFGGASRGIMKWLLAPLAGFASRRATTYVTNHRSGISGEAAPVAGDVILYQTRGEKIRECIKHCAEKINDDVYLLAHSLGGIASVDLLAMSRPKNVRGLITVASQAPLLYEFDALVSTRNPGNLPAGFPQWLNIYDPRDFLSYMAEPVFDKTVVKDVEVRSGEPFPQSHSAYWNLDIVWTTIERFINQVEGAHHPAAS